MTEASIVRFTNSSSIDELNIAINIVCQENIQGLLLLTCVDNNYLEPQINKILSDCQLPIGGGMFPKIIYHGKNYSQGAIIVGLRIKPEIINYPMYNSDERDIDQYIQSNSLVIQHHKSFLILSDALCNASEDFVDHFYNYMGSGVTVIGGGAGSLDFLPRPVIYTNQGVKGYITQVIALPCSLINSIGHGWEIADGPYLVTSADGHYVHSLNYQSTFSLYKKVVQQQVAVPLSDNFFVEYAKSFPLGMASLDGEILVRDPIQTNASYLECVGNVLVNSMVYLLKSDKHKMLASTQKVANEIALDKQENKTLLLFNCISRDSFLGTDINEELSIIQNTLPETPLIGAMALGEIANTDNGSIRLLNKTTVLGAF
ncbi:FIST signal transduction protein [Psychromonas sp. 14N.309.X.WAT.B.A12]|uniref:FIST signal transduction protein n=1 Tax=unclassified Psychromonas TaxID=2614957 RepID=UPI0025B07898|nr:FIST C-terminal domain-containing protein [Psychromonas sp. 14N.309.X.WAT.B.A12]MDN2663431.1 FIST C-terminal domain-containing protein [Psychromonas sp. 14N.309.X.WAT.B.A12]